MKKLFITLGLVAAMTIPALAQQPTETTQCCKAKTECCKAKADGRKDKKEGRKGKADFANIPVDSLPAFQGINLTETQRTEIEKIRTEARAAKADAQKDLKKDRQDLKKDAVRGERQAKKDFRKDKQRGQAFAKKGQGFEKRMEARLQYLRRYKAVLSPEQYIQFLENTAASGK